MTVAITLITAANAATCVYAGDRQDYFRCIADQSGANEDDIATLDASVVDLDVRLQSLEVGAVSVAGLALHPDRAGNTLSLLTNGAAYAADPGTTFTLGAISLPHGATILALDCTLKDEDPTGYVQAVLYRADRDEPSVFSSTVLAFLGTIPGTNSADYLRYADATDPLQSVVDNDRYSYFIRVDLLDVTATFANVAVHSCGVSYIR